MIYYTIVPAEDRGVSTFSASPALYEILSLLTTMQVMTKESSLSYLEDTMQRMTINYD